MFSSIADLLNPGAALVLIVTKNESNELSVSLTPKGDLKNKALNAGLQLVASPEELDREFATVIARYATARASLIEQVEAAATVLSKEGTAVATTTAKKLAAPAKAKTRPGAVTPAEDEGDGDDEGDGEGEEGAVAQAPARPKAATVTTPAADASANGSNVSLF